MSEENKISILENINKWFNSIGTPYSKSITMQYIIDDDFDMYEENENTFTSLNFVINLLINYKPSLYVKLLNKLQAIRFIRIIQQYIIKTRNTNIVFLPGSKNLKKTTSL